MANLCPSVGSDSNIGWGNIVSFRPRAYAEGYQMICTPELINGRWVLPLSEELLDGVRNPAEVGFRVERNGEQPQSDINPEEEASDVIDAFDRMSTKYDTMLKNLAK